MRQIRKRLFNDNYIREFLFSGCPPAKEQQPHLDEHQSCWWTRRQARTLPVKLCRFFSNQFTDKARRPAQQSAIDKWQMAQDDPFRRCLRLKPRRVGIAGDGGQTT
ncbi:hypothetical protein Q8A73_003050 [Channa argus]|nr:hypothetical protein Q8A73_003050 [Channa argus]